MFIIQSTKVKKENADIIPDLIKDKESNPSLDAILILIFCILCVYFVLWAFTGILSKPNTFNSYALQAKAWLSGRLDIGQNYSYLEIATYNGKFYISFPPFPSVVLLPFVLLFDVKTPDHLITTIVGIIGAVYALKIACLKNKRGTEAVFWALFATIGSNFLYFSTNGSVWFMAQTFSFSLCMAAIYYALTKEMKVHPWLSLLLWAFAIGCRPMQIIYFPFLVYLLYEKYKYNNEKGLFPDFIKKHWKWLIAPAVVGVFYMGLNLARFNNPLEFGHNYLPEFINAEQFSTSYIGNNLTNLLRLPTASNGKLNFPTFDGVAFWLVSPIYISFIIYGIREVIRKESEHTKMNFYLIGCLVLIHFIVICMHKTLGGYQFGNRYTVDAIPFIFPVLLMFNREKSTLKTLDYGFCFWGICLNVVGYIALFNKWI